MRNDLIAQLQIGQDRIQAWGQLSVEMLWHTVLNTTEGEMHTCHAEERQQKTYTFARINKGAILTRVVCVRQYSRVPTDDRVLSIYHRTIG